jgi:hypothetical protein
VADPTEKWPAYRGRHFDDLSTILVIVENAGEGAQQVITFHAVVENNANARIVFLAPSLDFIYRSDVGHDAIEDERRARLDTPFALEALRIAPARSEICFNFCENRCKAVEVGARTTSGYVVGSKFAG